MRKHPRMTALGGGFLFLCLSAMPALADMYRLGAGDKLSLDLSGWTESEALTIDADGQIRITELGGVSLAGLTLDEAEEAVAKAMVDQGIFVDPNVSLMVTAYAPVMVGGDVASPGRQDYVAGMTVASAIALSGGSQSSGVTRFELARARTEAENNMRSANLQIAAAVTHLARIDAFLNGTEIVIDEAAEGMIPDLAAVDLGKMIENETAELAEQASRTDQLLAFWENEIRTLEAQRTNYDGRIQVQNSIVVSTAEALESARELQERGLQTSTRLASAEQRDAEARSRVLELESLKLQTTRAIASAQREQVQYMTRLRSEALEDRRKTQVQAEAEALRYRRFLEQLGLLSGGNSGALLASDAITLEFQLLTTRANRPDNKGLTLDTPIYPGETLIVSVTAGTDDIGG